MPGMIGLVRHLNVACVSLFTCLALFTPFSAPSIGAWTQDPPATASTFVITIRGVRVGTESVTVTRPGGAFKISATGQIGPPVDLVTSKFELLYTADWQPQHLIMEGSLRNETLNIATTFGITTATNEVVQGPNRGGVTHQVTPRTLVLQVNSFGAYEAFASRLGTVRAGERLPVYIAPEGEIT